MHSEPNDDGRECVLHQEYREGHAACVSYGSSQRNRGVRTPPQWWVNTSSCDEFHVPSYFVHTTSAAKQPPPRRCLGERCCWLRCCATGASLGRFSLSPCCGESQLGNSQEGECDFACVYSLMQFAHVPCPSSQPALLHVVTKAAVKKNSTPPPSLRLSEPQSRFWGHMSCLELELKVSTKTSKATTL